MAPPLITPRQRLQALLREAPMTLWDVVEALGCRLKEAEGEVQHAAKSARPARLRVVEPSVCGDCGYAFRERRRLTTPSRCPRCRSEATTPPRFWIA